VFSSNGQDGTLTVIKQDSADKYTVVENVKTEKSARTMALDPKTHKIYLPAAKFGPAPEATADNPPPTAQDRSGNVPPGGGVPELSFFQPSSCE